jgi:hypothetical protein
VALRRAALGLEIQWISSSSLIREPIPSKAEAHRWPAPHRQLAHNSPENSAVIAWARI